MNTIYLILLIIGVVFVLIFGTIMAIVNVDIFNPNTYICTAFLIPAMIINPDFELIDFYDGCGR